MESLFQLKANGTTVQREVVAGLTTFLTMAYIIFVNPSILQNAGMDFGAVFMATCLAAAFGSAFMGLYANYPIALAPGMGLNAYFTFGVVKGMGLSWEVALGAVVVARADGLFTEIVVDGRGLRPFGQPLPSERVRIRRLAWVVRALCLMGVAVISTLPFIFWAEPDWVAEVAARTRIALRHLEAIVGTDSFRDGLREYLKGHAFGNATWADLITVLERSGASAFGRSSLGGFEPGFTCRLGPFLPMSPEDIESHNAEKAGGAGPNAVKARPVDVGRAEKSAPPVEDQKPETKE